MVEEALNDNFCEECLCALDKEPLAMLSSNPLIEPSTVDVSPGSVPSVLSTLFAGLHVSTLFSISVWIP